MCFKTTEMWLVPLSIRNVSLIFCTNLNVKAALRVKSACLAACVDTFNTKHTCWNKVAFDGLSGSSTVLINGWSQEEKEESAPVNAVLLLSCRTDKC